jgi:hypothetical protein
MRCRSSLTHGPGTPFPEAQRNRLRSHEGGRCGSGRRRSPRHLLPLAQVRAPLNRKKRAMRSPCLDMVSKSSPLDRKPHRLDKRKKRAARWDCCRSARLFRQQRQLLVLTQARGLVFHFPKNVAWTIEVTAEKLETRRSDQPSQARAVFHVLRPRAPMGSGPAAPMALSSLRS